MTVKGSKKAYELEQVKAELMACQLGCEKCLVSRTVALTAGSSEVE